MGGTIGDIDSGNAIALDSSGNVYVSGQALSASFPTNNNSFLAGDYSTDATYLFNSGTAFISELDPTLSNLSFSTLFGGKTIGSDPSGFGDYATAIGVDLGGNIYVAGVTYACDFPTVNPLTGTTNTFVPPAHMPATMPMPQQTAPAMWLKLIH